MELSPELITLLIRNNPLRKKSPAPQPAPA